MARFCAADDRKAGSVRRQAVIAGIILLAAVAIGGLLIFLRQEPQQAEPGRMAPLVEVAQVEFRSGRLTVSAGGTVQPVERVSLAPQVSGRVVYVNPDLLRGGTVAAGETLLRIDPADFRNAVAAARAEVAQQRVAVTEAQEEVRIAQREAERFRTRNARLSSRLPVGVDADDYAARIRPPEELASAETDDREDNVELSVLATRRPQLQAAQAALAAAQARLQDAQLALSRTVLRSPYSGVVASESVGVGTFVSTGQTVAELISTQAHEVVVPLTSSEAALLPELFRDGGPDLPAAVYYTYGGRRYRWDAYVARAANVLSDETRTIDVYLRVSRPITGGTLAADQRDTGDEPNRGASVSAPPLLVGSFVDVSLAGRVLARYAVIPLAGLKRDDTIWVVRDGKVQVVEIAVVQRDDKFAYARPEGIPPDAKIIVGGIDLATQGMTVRIDPSQAPARAPPQDGRAE